jgi:microcystin-dependent protein
MPSDSNGVYSLPPGYLAADGTTITITQHNAPLEDIASGMTARLMRSGVAPMTGPLQLADGSRAEPSLTLASSPLNGLYAHESGAMAMVGVVGATPVGSIMDFAGTTAPTAWLLCYGQAVSRTTYAVLFSVIGTAFGVGDGSTTFNVPDCRGRNAVGKLDMGGVAGTAIDTTTYGANPATLGALGGVKNTTIAQANFPAMTWPNTLGVTLPTTIGSWPTKQSTISPPVGGIAITVTDPAGTPTNLDVGVTKSATAPTVTGSVTTGGSDTPISRIAPGIIFNKIIYTGV